MIMLVPVAVAQADTIKAAAGTQFSGVVDSSPSCTDTAATIDWGDGKSSAGTVDQSTNAVSGTHTYGTAGTYNGTVTLTGGDCPLTSPSNQDKFTANVQPAPQFTQCPPVNNNFGCQFLITVSSSGTSVASDPNQPAYDSGGDDALIGIQNNSSGPISSVPLSVPGSALFGFESDGLCMPGALPIPGGCRPAGSSATSSCDGVSSCAFPPAPGQPAGYTEPGALSGSTQNGYEGPRNWYSGVSVDQTSGRVNFGPPLQPGESTYFSLEEPPVNTSINVGSSPSGLVGFPPTVSTTGARFTGSVNPNGSSTTADFQYGLDARYTSPNLRGPVYSQSTPLQSVGGDLSDHLITALVSHLVPNAVYHFRIVAKNADGTTFGPDVQFTTAKDPAPPAGVLGTSEDVVPVSGLVLVKLPGGKSPYAAADAGAAAVSKGQGFFPLTEARRIPVGSQIDARLGSLQIQAAPSVRHGKRQVGTFAGGLYKLSQFRRGPSKGLTTLSLLEGAFRGAPTYASCPKAASDGAHAAVSRRVLQTLRGNAHGAFRTSGRYAAATVRGTNWGTVDRCDGTLTLVHRGTVAVSDFVRHVTVIVHAGHQYLAHAPAKKKH